MRTWARAVPWAGLFSGPFAWGISTQLLYGMADEACVRSVRLAPWIALGLVVAALAGAFVSWRSYDAPGSDEERSRVHRFLSVIGVAVGLLFGFVILLQGMAGTIFTGCER
jgi:hypothetical protein